MTSPPIALCRGHKEEYDAASQVPIPELQILKKETEDPMFARLTQLIAKPGQGPNLTQAGRELIERLKERAGFIDTLLLSSDTDPNQFVGITLWKSKEDAEKALASQQGQQFLQSLKPLLQSDPVFRTFNVETSTTHNIGITRAAGTSS
jgi:quinol monooxygenase YgiN